MLATRAVRRRWVGAAAVIVAVVVGGVLAVQSWSTDSSIDPNAQVPQPSASSGALTGGTIDVGESDPLPSGAAVPEFEGPYASRFEQAYTQSTSELQRQVLEDGVVTEAEMNALRDDVVGCIQNAGIDEAWFEDGGLTLRVDGMSDTEVNAIVGGCQELGFGTVDMLYASIGSDPENVGQAALVVPCLQRAGLVGDDYTPDDFEQDSAAGTLPFDPNDPQFSRCIANPDS